MQIKRFECCRFDFIEHQYELEIYSIQDAVSLKFILVKTFDEIEPTEARYV